MFLGLVYVYLMNDAVALVPALLWRHRLLPHLDQWWLAKDLTCLGLRPGEFFGSYPCRLMQGWLAKASCMRPLGLRTYVLLCSVLSCPCPILFRPVPVLSF